MKYNIIYQKWDGAGHFARFTFVLEQLLRMSEINDSLNENDPEYLTPYFDFKSKVSNLRDLTNTEILNEWEYCFEQDLTLEEVLNSNHVHCDGEYIGRIPSQLKYFHHKDFVDKINFLFNKYIKIKPLILSQINNDITKYKTLAVHCRRSDMARFHTNIALNYSEELFFQKAMKIFEENNFERIYIATEEISIFNYFKEKINDILIYQDCYRIHNNQSPVFEMDNRPLHRTLQAQEVLIDALNMSKCDSLVCGISGVSTGAIFINGNKYNQVYYFDEINLV